jgi:hypothetical protein
MYQEVGQEHDIVCTRKSDSSGVEVFILAAVCEEIEKTRKKKKKRFWVNDVFVSRCDEGEFQRLR